MRMYDVKMYDVNLLAFRAMAFFWAFSAVRILHNGVGIFLPGVVQQPSRNDWAPLLKSIALVVPVPAMLLLSAGVLWTLAPRLSNEGGKGHISPVQEEIQVTQATPAVGPFSLARPVILFIALTLLVQGLTTTLMRVGYSNMNTPLERLQWAVMGPGSVAGFQLCLGLVLLLLHRPLAMGISWFGFRPSH